MYMPTLKRQWTVDDLEDLPDDGNRYEIIDGELLVTPAPSLDHQEAVLRLATLLTTYVPEYWIVDLDSRTVERSTPADPRVEVAADQLVWRPEGAATQLVVDLTDYFARILDD